MNEQAVKDVEFWMEGELQEALSDYWKETIQRIVDIAAPTIEAETAKRLGPIQKG